jgi:PST family polysaccharide transporter
LRPFGPSGGFGWEVSSGNLSNQAVRAAGVTVFAQGIAFAVQMLGTVVLARLLTPRDFGFVTIATTFSLLLGNFGLNGFTEAVLQVEAITERLASNLFWFNLVAGAVLSGAFAFAGAWIARFYGAPPVRQICVGLAFSIFLGSLSIIHLALLKRAMYFGPISVQDVISRVVSVGGAVLLGWKGYGYWALVAGTVLQALYVSASAWWMCRWTPRLPTSAPETGKTIYFALNTYAHFVVSYFAKNLDNILLGWRFGAISLGLYKKAYDLFVLPTSQLLSPMSPVVVSTLSRLKKDPAEYNRWFLRGLSVLALIGMVIGADLTLIGKDVIRLVLGPQWDVTGRIFTYFGPGIGLMLIYNTHSWMHLSLGQADRWLRWGLVEVGVTVSLFLLALSRGPAGIAVAWTVSYAILTIPALWYAGGRAGFKVGPVVALMVRYAAASLIAGWLCAEMMRKLPLGSMPGAAGATLRIVTNSCVLTVLYVAAVVLLHGGFEPFRQVARLIPALSPGSGRIFCMSYQSVTSSGEAGEISSGRLGA